MKRAAILSAFAIMAGSAAAQPSVDIQWDLIAVEPQQAVFFDARPDRIDSSVESSTVFTFHILKTPMKGPNGTPYTMWLQRTKFSCLEPTMSPVFIVAYDDAWNVVFTNDVVTPQMPFAPGTVTEDISIMACDHFNPTDYADTFSNRDAAIAFARAKLSGG